MRYFMRSAGMRVSLVLISLSLLTGIAGAQQVQTVSMGKYISSCLYNFSRYIDWPADKKSGDFIITIVGSKDVYNQLTALTQNMKVGLQSIQVKYASSVNDLSGFQHIIFINDLQSSKINAVLQRIADSGTLLVTETEGMITRGSMINFIPVDGMMKFEISQENLKKNKLMASVILQKMAVNIN